MTTKTSLLTILSFLAWTTLAAAAESPTRAAAADSQLMMQGKDYPLKHTLAYETNIDGEEKIVVLLTSSKVSGLKLKEARAAEKAGESVSFERPYLRLEYSKAGEFQSWSAAAGSAMIGSGRHSATGELKSGQQHVTGQATQPNEPKAIFPFSFTAHFDVALLGPDETLPGGDSKKPGPAANVKPTVTGVFKGNGKEAKLSYVSAHWREPFDDKPSIVLVFTEKDHAQDPKPDFHAGFGQFGAALVISLHEDGTIFGCEVVHPALKHQGFTSLGQVRTSDFQFAEGKVEGELATDGSVEVFGDHWEAALKFVAPLGEIPAKFQPAAVKKAGHSAEEEPGRTDEPEITTGDEEDSSSTAANKLKVKDLAWTKDARDFEYKAIVEQLNFTSKADVKSTCAELNKALKAQGWTTDGSDLVTSNSAILKRKQGQATLTIFVKPGATGSTIKVMTKGLSWDGA